MHKTYKICLDNTLIGTTQLEKADPPMGLVFGDIVFVEQAMGYDHIKKYCIENNITLSSDSPADKLLFTQTIEQLTVQNEEGVEITGTGNQIYGMDSEGFVISLEGVPYPFYAEEFPHHVKAYEDMFE